jgi:formyltetrahydrofolate synthetase
MMTLYSSAFNLLDNSFSYKETIDNFCNFADNVCVAINISKDNTLDELNKLTKIYKNLQEFKVFNTGFTVEGIFGGRLLAIKSKDFITYYDWET